MLARLKREAARLGRKVIGWDNRINAAEKKVETLTGQIDRKAARLPNLIERADAARRRGDYLLARDLDKQAIKLAAELGAAKEKRRFWIGRAKDLRIEKKGYVKAKADLEKQIKELEAKKVRFDVPNNRVTGGSEKDRFIGACLLSAKRCAEGKRPNFYSQPGTYTTDACFTGETWNTTVRERSDCSQWVTSVCRAAGLDDPNGTNWTGGGYTGTLLQAHGKWRETDRDTFIKRGWGYCVYGTGTGFHVEAFIGGTKTIGHGDAAINEGHLDMFGDRRYFVYS